MVQQLLALARKEWQTVKGAPWLLGFVVLICMTLGYQWALHEEKGHEQSLSDLLNLEKQGRDNEKSALEQRIAGKDDLLTDYRSRLLMAEMQTRTPIPGAATETQRRLNTAATRFSSAKSADLSRMAIELAGKIRKLSQEFGLKRNTIVSEQMESVANAQSKPREEQNKIWARFSGMTMNTYTQETDEYSARYKADAIVLSDEMLSRLPPGTRNDFVHYDTAAAGIERIATDLERLAKLLPD